MAFEEDLSQFFDQKDFAVEAVIKSGAAVIRTISVIFNDPTQDVAVFDAEVQSNLPFAQCESSDLVGVTHAHTMTIGATVYRIKDIHSDGTGISIVQLRA